MNPLRVALIQNDAGSDPVSNLRALESLMDQARNPDLIALPEVFALRAGSAAHRASAEIIPGRISKWLANQAHERGCWIIGGSIVEECEGQIFNTLLVYDPQGAEAARYRKIHLYDAELTTGEVLRESDHYTPGRTPQMTSIGDWLTGLSICYDLRFPELFRTYTDASLLVVPANFTRHTGEAHWEPLLRARAIENQCFVIAPGQCGVHPETGVVTHGHSLIIDPWGRVLADGGADPGLVEAVLEPTLIAEARQQVPALRHKRL